MFWWDGEFVLAESKAPGKIKAPMRISAIINPNAGGERGEHDPGGAPDAHRVHGRHGCALCLEAADTTVAMSVTLSAVLPALIPPSPEVPF